MNWRQICSNLAKRDDLQSNDVRLLTLYNGSSGSESIAFYTQTVYIIIRIARLPKLCLFTACWSFILLLVCRTLHQRVYFAVWSDPHLCARWSLYLPGLPCGYQTRCSGNALKARPLSEMEWDAARAAGRARAAHCRTWRRPHRHEALNKHYLNSWFEVCLCQKRIEKPILFSDK